MGDPSNLPPRRLPIDFALHYLTNVVSTPDGVAMNHDAGRLVEALAPRVRTLTLLAYEPPDVLTAEDETPFRMEPAPPNLRIVSLGPKGTWRSYRERGRRVRHIVAEHSGSWDLLLLRLINRRAHLVWSANRCPRVVTQVGGSNLEYRLGASMPLWKRVIALPAAYWEERNQRRLIASARITFVVGESLQERYARVSPKIRILRHSALRDGDFHLQPDRLTQPDVRFLFAGQMLDTKGVFDAVDAFARIRAELFPQAHLDLAGHGPQTDEVHARVAELGITDAVTFHGWIGDRAQMLDLYRRADVLLCLSHVDFMPRVVWEAFASSVLVVATPAGTLPKAFTDRTELVFVPMQDPGAVVDVVRTLRDDADLRRGLVARAAERAREATIDRMVDGMLDELVATWPELAGAQERQR